MAESRKTDIQTEAAILFVNQKDSTHTDAPKASAARLIRILRSAYSEIPTPTETSSESESHRAQRVLITYLNQLIRKLEKEDMSNIVLSEDEQKYLNYPGIKSTIEWIELIKNTPLIKDTKLKTYYSIQDKIKVFKQMQSIAITYPGPETEWNWNKQHAEWSTNQLSIYNPKLPSKTESVEVMASPGETLNLTCRAMLDQSRYLKDQQDVKPRIASFFTCCFELQTQVEQRQFETCSTGRQHELLFLLNRSYLDKPNTEASAEPIKLIEDGNAFLVDSMTHFLEEKMKTLSSEEKSQLCMDWMSHDNGLAEYKIAPAVTFLRKQYPVSDGVDVDARWKDALTQFLVQQCRAFYLNPKTYDLNYYLKQLEESFRCPTSQSNTTYLNAILAKKHILSDESELTPLRNKAFYAFRTEMQSHAHSLGSQADVIQYFYVALQLFDNIHRYKDLTLFIGKDEGDFERSLQTLKQILQQYFTRYLTKDFPEDFFQRFETIKENYLEQEKQFKEKSHADVIVNFFGGLDNTKKSVRDAFARLEVIPHGILLSDETLATWEKEHKSQMTIALSSYEINRILLHGLTQSPTQWSPTFCGALAFVTNQLNHLAAESENIVKAFKKNYPSELLQTLLFLATIKQNAPVDIKELFATLMDLDLIDKQKIIYKNLFFSLRLDVLLRADEFIKILEWMTNCHIDFNQPLPPFGATPLYMAAEHGNHELVRALLAKGSDPSLKFKDQWTPFLAAAERGHMEVVALLIRSASDFKHMRGVLNSEQIRAVVENKTVQTKLSQIINNYEDYITVLDVCGSEQEKTAVYESVKTKFPQIINDDLRCFRAVLSHLRSEQAKEFCEILKNKLTQIINDSRDFYNAISFIGPEQITAVYESFKTKLPQIINNGEDFSSVFCLLDGEQRTAVYESVKTKLPQIINNPKDFRHVLFYLNSEQRTAVYGSVKSKLPQIIKNEEDFLKVTGYLNEEQRIEVSQFVIIPQVSDSKHAFQRAWKQAGELTADNNASSTKAPRRPSIYGIYKDAPK